MQKFFSNQVSKYVVIARYYVCKRNLKGFTTTALCAPFQRIQEVLRNVFWGYSIDMDTKELSYEFVTLRYLQEKAQKVIWILGQTTMDAESLLQIQNNYSKNVTFAKLITYMEYGF